MLLAVNGGLATGGVGTCRIGNGGALLAMGSVMPGMVGIKGGREMPRERTGETRRPTAERVDIEGNMLKFQNKVVWKLCINWEAWSECEWLSCEKV
jgi:hypothetical protein